MKLKCWTIKLHHLDSEKYTYLREICNLSRAIYNTAIYNIRQHYFSEGTYLRYETNYHLMKDLDIYQLLGANVSQQSMKAADRAFKSFFALLDKSNKGIYERWKVHLPNYIPQDTLLPVTFTQMLSTTLSSGKFTIPVSFRLRKKYPNLSCKFQLDLPNHIIGKSIHQIMIIPKCKGKYFEAKIYFEDMNPVSNSFVLDANKALAIDLGINNFATCATSIGKSFIIDGRKVKSINQWYNKELSRLNSIKDKQKITGCTQHQYIITYSRERRISDFIYKSAKYIVQYCINNDIGNLVVGYNDGFQDKVNLGKVNNQQFVMLPYGKFKNRLQYLCSIYGITYVEQEESYTSKASFWDKDEIPKWNPLNPKQGEFSGKRIHRGLYQTKSGKFINADVNGALNILRKSKVVDLKTLYCSGVVQAPLRIRLA